jgi:glycosyltransferase involved in cell wall biosynthesis
MVILHVLLYKNHGAGTTKVFLEYAKGLTQYGKTVHNAILVPSALAQMMEEQKLPFHALKYHPFWPFTLASNLRDLIEKIQPHVVLAHGRRAVRYGSWVLKNMGQSSCLPQTSNFSAPPPLVGVAHSFKGLKTFEKADHVIGVSQALVQELERTLVPRKHLPFHRSQPHTPSIHVLPNMLSWSTLATPKRGAILKPNHPSDHGLFSDSNSLGFGKIPVIGALGRLRPIKGFDIWIKALGILKNHGYIFKAKLGGTGDQRNYLEKYSQKLGLENQLEFLDWVSPESFFPQIDIFTIPSRCEPFGMVFLESWAYGKPVVSTKVDGLAEIGTHGENVLFVPPDHPEAMAEALAQLLDYPYLWEFLSNQAKQTLKNYSPDTLIPKLCSILQTSLS